MATASFKFDTGAHGSLNDTALKDLPLGKHNYVITKLSIQPVKADQTKKRKHLVIELRHSDGQNYTKFLEIHPKSKEPNEVTRARIAAEEFNAYVLATGIKKGVVITPAKFKSLCNKPIGIETTKTENKATKKSYINVKQIVKGGWSEDEGIEGDDSDPQIESEPETEPYDDEPEEDEDELTEDEDEVEDEDEDEDEDVDPFSD